MPCSNTAEFRTELNLNCTGRTVAGRRYQAIRQLILQKCQERNSVSPRQAGDILWGQVGTEDIGESTLHSFQAKFNLPPNGPYRSFHVALDSLIIDVLKKAAESRQNARLNSEDELAEDADGADGEWGAERTVARP